MPERAWGFKSPLRHQVAGLPWAATHKPCVEVVSPSGDAPARYPGGHVCPDRVPPGQLAELLVSAANQLVAPEPAAPVLAPMGVPVRCGRLHLGRLRGLVDAEVPLAVAAGFGTACWLGPEGVAAPNLGRLGYRARAVVDGRGRVVLDRRVRTWLAVENEGCFEAVTIPAPEGGILVVPIEDFARRWEVIPR